MNMEKKSGSKRGELTMTSKCRVMRLKTIFTRSRPSVKHFVNVGTIGHIDHGKTTLQSAIQSVLGSREDQRYLRGELHKSPVQQKDLSMKHLYRHRGLR